MMSFMGVCVYVLRVIIIILCIMGGRWLCCIVGIFKNIDYTDEFSLCGIGDKF